MHADKKHSALVGTVVHVVSLGSVGLVGWYSVDVVSLGLVGRELGGRVRL